MKRKPRAPGPDRTHPSSVLSEAEARGAGGGAGLYRRAQATPMFFVCPTVELGWYPAAFSQTKRYTHIKVLERKGTLGITVIKKIVIRLSYGEFHGGSFELFPRIFHRSDPDIFEFQIPTAVNLLQGPGIRLQTPHTPMLADSIFQKINVDVGRLSTKRGW